jgi:type 2 lantibiotic biosynthesis protein LanM
VLSVAADWPRALTLSERAALPPPAGSPAPSSDGELARLRLAQWRDLSPFRSGDAFARRLALEGLDEPSFAQLLAEPAEARLPESPEWLAELAEAFSVPEATILAPLPLLAELRGDPAAGFLELVRPLIAPARERLRAGIGRIIREAAAPPPFSLEEAERLVTEPLALRLLPLLARTLVLELHVARLQGALPGETPEERFAAFVERLLDRETAEAIFKEYPVLARLVVEELRSWVEVSLELLARLAADWPGLVEVFFAGRDPGPLASLGGGAGDRHRGGRAVRIAGFASGAKLVYKPRSLAADLRFQDLLGWLEEAGTGLGWRRLAVLDRGDYGWMEFVAAEGCAEEGEVALYHRRLGGLLALLHALEATDCHFENLIAARDQPVIVDLEALFHPRLTGKEPPRPDERLAGEVLSRSVLRIGLLPFRVGENEEFAGVDLSGVAVVAGQPTPQPVMQWQDIGTDAMRVVRERVLMEQGSNRPTLDGREVEAAEHTAEMAAGFAAVYRLLARRRAELLAPGGPLAGFADAPVRAVLRPTRVYGLLLAESFHPDVLRDALDRDLLFDRLWVGIEDLPDLVRVIRAEHRDLWAGDIPSFSAVPSLTDLWTSRGDRIPGFFAEPAFETVRRRLLEMDEEDLRSQLSLLRLSLGTQLLNNDDVGWTGYAAVEPGPPLPDRELRERLLARAREVGAWFESMAVRDERYATWIGLDYRNRVWSLGPAPEDLYAGLPGIALFLGYLGAVAGEERWTALARAALDALLARFDGEGAGPASVGAFIGWGGIVYTLAHLGAVWRDANLLAAAERLAERIPPLLATDEDLDVIGGSSGAILGLLALHRATGSRRALEIAILCGERLLSRAHAAGPGLGWLTRLATERPQIGFSHGNAGIGLALVELGAATVDARFNAAGLAAFAWERAAFWPELRRWRGGGGEVPPPLESTVAMAWCYGAPGVGLARLAALRHAGDEEAKGVLEAEMRDAVRWTADEGFGQNHCLCHGDLGNLDFLLEANGWLDEPALAERIRDRTQAVLASIERDGFLCGTRGGVEAPGLMNGLAGIGYGLLRRVSPKRVPSVLALAPPPAL